ncbi:MAG: PQQ-binding-like beta-propeller repeat protein [Planctomycetota bacterium]|jgi:outer membrane protein assembly factor BamB
MKQYKAVIGLLLVACISFSSFAADWPQWRGPDYNGISTETDWDPESLKNPDIAWKIEIGTGFSAISVADGKAYAMGNIDKKTDVVYCFDALTGDEKWRHEYPEPLDPKWYDGGSSATPTIHEGKVYTLSKQGVAFCFDAQTGDILWEKKLDFKPPTWGFSGSALILDDLVIYNVGAAGLALNKASGDVVWKSDNDVSGYATPVPYEQDGKTYICLFAKDTVMGVEAQTGKISWSYPWKTNHDVNAADPIVVDNKVFITSGYGHGCALLDISGAEPALIWDNKNMRSQMSGPVLIDGFLYGFDDNQLVCLDWKTGEQKWTEKSPRKGCLSAADDKLIVIGEKGKLFIVQATPEGYQELSSAQVLEHLCWAMPVLANGHIYIRDAKKNTPNNLICVNVQKKKNTKAQL